MPVTIVAYGSNPSYNTPTMKWIALAYSLPSQPQSTQRVALWRRLRRLGAISPAGGLYLLPDQPDCVEAFQWLAQEIQQAQGEALACLVERVDGLSEQQLIELFNAARQKEYEEVDAQLAELEAALLAHADARSVQETLSKLRRQMGELARIDYFHAPAQRSVQERLVRLEQTLAPEVAPSPALAPQAIAAYVGKRWVTRPRPHVDRLACAWLIRRFIDATAPIRYAPASAPEEIAFDMEQAHFGHHGNLCTFETLLAAFGLDDLALRSMAEIVHEIDLRDGRFVRPETSGIEAVLNGWRLAALSDAELEERGTALFEGLYRSYQSAQGPAAGLPAGE